MYVTPLFSQEDNDLSNIKWHKHTAGYAVRSAWSKESKCTYKVHAHRVVLQRTIGRPLVKGELTDHINRNKLDNRRENLRVADKSINAVNTNIRSDNSTGYNGVYKYHPTTYKDNGWKAAYVFRIYRKGHKVFYSKNYKTPEEAHQARLEKLKEYIY